MPTELTTPRAHRVLGSPLGRAFESQSFERVVDGTLPRQLGIRRARAGADVALGHGPAAFLEAVDTPPAPELHGRIERALATYADYREAYDAAQERWEDAFWGDEGEPVDADELVAIERERRRTANQRAEPNRLFRFLGRRHLLPPVKYDLPHPDDAAHQWASYISNPERLYGFDEALPAVERSRAVRGPGTSEYFLRFETPSPYVGETATARVYEPAGPGTGEADADTDADDVGRESLPTIVFNHGLFSQNDMEAYWPEEAYLGRPLARQGYRVILPDAPWHGRREELGSYSGEPYLARGPVGMFQLFAAAAQENAVLVDWARERGAPVVAVGGISLGGITSFHVAGRCGLWPESTRPDLVFPVAAPGVVDETIVRSRLMSVVGCDDVLRGSGWTPARIDEFGPVLNPPRTLDVDPERLFAFYSSEDDLAPTDTTRELLDAWSVPVRNRTAWDVGHYGMLFRLIRRDEFQKRVTAELDAIADERSVDESAEATA